MLRCFTYAKKTIAKIIKNECDYVAQVKKNQPTLFKEVQHYCHTKETLHFNEVHEKGHGRHTSWYINVFDARKSRKTEEWLGLKRFIHIRRVCLNTKTQKTNTSDQYYISSNTSKNAIFYFNGIRGHWKIENSLHWVKDVIHKEDKNRIKTGNAPVNIAVISAIAINIHRKNGDWSITQGQAKSNSNLEESMKLIRT